MPDISLGGRDLNFAGTISVKYRKNGAVVTKTKAEIIANAAGEQTDIQAIIGIGADTITAEKLGYALNSAGAILDEDSNPYLNTWQTGKALQYTTIDMHGNIFTDEGATV